MKPKNGHIVGLAASLGGLQAFRSILSSLPADFPAPIVLLQHVSPLFPSFLPKLLAQHTPLRVKEVEDGDRLRAGTVYTTRPGRHMLVTPGQRLALSESAPVQFARPSADLLFASMAEHCEARAIAVILTGRGCDGADGAKSIRERGGFVIAQSESSATCSDMPYAAVLTRKVDLVLPIHQIGFALETLVSEESLTTIN